MHIVRKLAAELVAINLDVIVTVDYLCHCWVRQPSQCGGKSAPSSARSSAIGIRMNISQSG
jgi:hypothetical protein